MLDEALGVIGLTPDAFWHMGWDEYEYARQRYARQQQEALVGHRIIATLLYNIHCTNDDPKLGKIVPQLSHRELLSLPLIDGPAPAKAAPKETQSQTWARLQEAGLL